MTPSPCSPASRAVSSSVMPSEVLVIRPAEVREGQDDQHPARGGAVRSRARMKAREDPERGEQPEGHDALIRELALARPPGTARWANGRWACGRNGQRLGEQGGGGEPIGRDFGEGSADSLLH